LKTPRPVGSFIGESAILAEVNNALPRPWATYPRKNHPGGKKSARFPSAKQRPESPSILYCANLLKKFNLKICFAMLSRSSAHIFIMAFGVIGRVLVTPAVEAGIADHVWSL
jgi:hypothetical protein